MAVGMEAFVFGCFATYFTFVRPLKVAAPNSSLEGGIAGKFYPIHVSPLAGQSWFGMR